MFKRLQIPCDLSDSKEHLLHKRDGSRSGHLIQGTIKQRESQVSELGKSQHSLSCSNSGLSLYTTNKGPIVDSTNV